jgi:hypothetical protein
MTHMSRTVQIPTHTSNHHILTWLCDHVGQVRIQHVYSACGAGWTWHYATGVRLSDQTPITVMHRIEFEDHVHADLIMQFVLTFS